MPNLGGSSMAGPKFGQPEKRALKAPHEVGRREAIVRRSSRLWVRMALRLSTAPWAPRRLTDSSETRTGVPKGRGGAVPVGHEPFGF